MTNLDTSKLYNQFILDANRVDIFLDSQKYEGDSTSLFMTLWELFKSNAVSDTNVSKIHNLLSFFSFKSKNLSSLNFKLLSNEKAARSLQFCTQAALADYFAYASQKYCKNSTQHIIDGGRQMLEIFTKNQRSIHIRKPFKIVEFDIEDSSSIQEEQLLILDLKYYVEDGTIKANWTLCDKEDDDWEFL